jgi:hypothetical protein
MKTLLFLIGPPAVGKMTVGLALQELTGLRLFHNHLSIEAVLPIFPFGSEPFSRLVNGFRVRVFEEVAESNLPGLIFTYVWAFDDPQDRMFVERMKRIFESRGGRAVFVELRADLETRLQRNATELRLSHKPSKRDLELSRARLLDHEARQRSSSDDDFPFAEYLRIDNTRLPPEEVARLIADHFSLYPGSNATR